MLAGVKCLCVDKVYCNLTIYTLVLQACQYDIVNDAFVVLGTTSSVVWDVTDEKNYRVTFGGGDPTYDGRRTR